MCYVGPTTSHGIDPFRLQLRRMAASVEEMQVNLPSHQADGLEKDAHAGP